MKRALRALTQPLIVVQGSSMAALARSWSQLAAWLCAYCALCLGCSGGQTGTPTTSSACETSQVELQRAERQLEVFEGDYVGPAIWQTAQSGAQTVTTLHAELVVVDGSVRICQSSTSAEVRLDLRTEDGALEVSLPATLTRGRDGAHVDWQLPAGQAEERALSGQLLLFTSGSAALEAEVGDSALRADELSKEEQ